MQAATLTIKSDNKPYANSCSVGQILRRPGIYSWDLSLQSDVEEIDLLGFVANDYLWIKLFTDPTLFWDLKYGQVRDFSNFQVNQNSGDIITYTINIAGSADKGPGTRGADGWIKAPSYGTPWWPPTADGFNDKCGGGEAAISVRR